MRTVRSYRSCLGKAEWVAGSKNDRLQFLVLLRILLCRIIADNICKSNVLTAERLHKQKKCISFSSKDSTSLFELRMFTEFCTCQAYKSLESEIEAWSVPYNMLLIFLLKE